MPDEYDRLAEQQAAAQAQLSERTLTMLAALWASVAEPGDPDQLSTFLARAVVVVRTAELAVGRLTESFLRQALRLLGIPVPAERLVALPESLRLGVPLTDVLERPAATVRYLRSVDTPPDVAAAAGLARLNTIGETNLELAMRQASTQVLTRAPGVRGYRRILRPYLSEGGSCGLCIVAADRIYRVAELLPIHGKCKCSVLPVTRASDPGLRLNSDDLQQLYGDAGGTAAAKLKRTRYRIEQHGELGPVLVRQGQKFRSADEAADDLRDRRRRRAGQQVNERTESYRRQLATFEDVIPDLERRARAGEDVASALTWQRARVDELRRLLGSAAA